MNVTFRQLQLFRALVSSGSISGAAKEGVPGSSSTVLPPPSARPSAIRVAMDAKSSAEGVESASMNTSHSPVAARAPASRARPIWFTGSKTTVAPAARATADVPSVSSLCSFPCELRFAPLHCRFPGPCASFSPATWSRHLCTTSPSVPPSHLSIQSSIQPSIQSSTQSSSYPCIPPSPISVSPGSP